MHISVAVTVTALEVKSVPAPNTQQQAFWTCQAHPVHWDVAKCHVVRGIFHHIGEDEEYDGLHCWEAPHHDDQHFAALGSPWWVTWPIPSATQPDRVAPIFAILKYYILGAVRWNVKNLQKCDVTYSKCNATWSRCWYICAVWHYI